MCGICGKLNTDPARPVSPGLLHDMCALMVHRGPDDGGVYTDGPVGLGHRRLSIIDIEGGHQPISNGDGSLWIVFNGEIYNHGELRRELRGKGYRYKTHTDTETILHAYAEYGVDCVERLRGMFAFAIWDARDGSLFLARDHFGVKPLYYTETNEGFLFASELKTLFLDENVDEAIDPVAVYDYFTFKYVPTPRTPFQAIKKLPQAHWMRVKDGATELRRYWHPEYSGTMPGTEGAHLEALEALLYDAVDEQRMSEVPLGLFLSGGVDSTLLALLHSKMSDQPVATFAMGFHGQRGFDEADYARRAAEAAGADHHVFNCGPEITGALPELLWHLEEPLSDAAMLPLYTLCREAAKHVTVVHCGDGADEAFGGYPRFFWDGVATGFGRVPGPLRRGLLAPGFRALKHMPGSAKNLGRRGEKFCQYAGLPEAHRYMTWFTMIPDDTKHQLLHPELLDAVKGYRSSSVFDTLFDEARQLGYGPLERRQYCELHNFVPDDLMLKTDKLAMAASLEGRFPFLDPRLVEFGLALPVREKMGPRNLKVLLKKLLAKYMPEDFVYRPKQGFEVPVSDWFRDRLNGELRDMVSDLARAGDTVFNPAYLESMLQQLHRGDPVAGRHCFSVYVFEHWRRQLGRPRAAVRARLAALPRTNNHGA